MRRLAIVIAFLCTNVTFAGEKLYKCIDASGKVEYANVECKGTAKAFDPSKGKGAVTRVKMPKVETPPEASGKPMMTPEQKRQMDELGIKPGGAVQMKPLVIPQSWLK